MEPYKIHSTTRAVQTRTKRATSPTRHPRTQFLGGGARVLRGKRPLDVSEQFILDHLEELKTKEKRGMLVVKTAGGALVNLNTLQAKPLPAPPLQPHPLMDSAANDKPTTNVVPAMAERSIPELLRPKVEETLDVEDGVVVTDHVALSLTPGDVPKDPVLERKASRSKRDEP